MGSKISVHLAVWGLRLALIAPVIMLIAGGLYRLRFVDFQIPLLAFAAAVLLAALAALFGLIGAVSGALGVHDKTIRAVVALAVALLVLVGPLNTLRQGAGAPMIHDITTDLEDPPIFVEVPRKRSVSDNSLDIDAEVLATQKAYYTDIGPTMLPMAKGKLSRLCVKRSTLLNGLFTRKMPISAISKRPLRHRFSVFVMMSLSAYRRKPAVCVWICVQPRV